jgi:hypothetical protein
MLETISEGKLTLTENHQPQGDTAKKGIERRKLLQMGLGALITAPFTSGIRPAVVRKAHVFIRKLTPKQATEYYRIYTKDGNEPPISILLSMFLYHGEINGIPRGNYTNERLSLDRAFFGCARVQRIIQAVITGEADERVKRKLQENLNRVGTGMRSFTPLWCGYSGWLKSRIIKCFHTGRLAAAPNDLLIHRKLDLEELIKLPLRDPYAEWP